MKRDAHFENDFCVFLCAVFHLSLGRPLADLASFGRLCGRDVSQRRVRPFMAVIAAGLLERFERHGLGVYPPHPRKPPIPGLPAQGAPSPPTIPTMVMSTGPKDAPCQAACPLIALLFEGHRNDQMYGHIRAVFKKAR